MGVLDAAIFGALSAIGAGLAGFDPGFIHLPRNDVGLAGKRRHPERVDDIRAVQPDADRNPHRYVDLVGGGELAPRHRVIVVDLPPPLMGGYVDGDAGLGRRRRDVRQHHHAPDQRTQKGHRRQADAGIDPANTAGRAGHRPGSGTARSKKMPGLTRQADRDQRSDHKDHDEADRQETPVQVQYRSRLVAGGAEHAQWRISTGDNRKNRDCGRQDCSLFGRGSHTTPLKADERR